MGTALAAEALLAILTATPANDSGAEAELYLVVRRGPGKTLRMLGPFVRHVAAIVAGASIAKYPGAEVKVSPLAMKARR